MYKEIMDNLKEQLTIDKLNTLKNKNLYLGVFSEPYLTFMLEGKKKVESRFSKKKIVPYGKITKDDIVLIKKSGGKVEGYFTIKEVLFFDLGKIKIEEIKKKYAKDLCVTEEFWDLKKDSCYATLLFIDELVKIEPFRIHKVGMQSFMKLNKSI